MRINQHRTTFWNPHETQVTSHLDVQVVSSSSVGGCGVPDSTSGQPQVSRRSGKSRSSSGQISWINPDVNAVSRREQGNMAPTPNPSAAKVTANVDSSGLRALGGTGILFNSSQKEGVISMSPAGFPTWNPAGRASHPQSSQMVSWLAAAIAAVRSSSRCFICIVRTACDCSFLLARLYIPLDSTTRDSVPGNLCVLTTCFDHSFRFGTIQIYSEASRKTLSTY